ncbi:hypothetical protein SAMN05428949_6503 [Chitinophaga sp. YR627]|uniref:hypothetical protein n=1 Tax=Chitinophaga sp. YR627 TaxID=1881041 RepID=UPI0008EE057B|nr:hypothetical protein [Chitinophaga sp. YR627]SFO75690.1 hypothetical protein SAMN05428949_6503 [Chitinophaga sp. YR627]
MLLRKIDFADPTIQSKLDLSSLNANLSWNDYYASYAYVIYQTMQAVFDMPYPYSPHGKAILFLMRHTLELQLKGELYRKGKTIPYSANVAEIIDELGKDVPKEIQRLIEIINQDQNGHCYRYHVDPCTKSTYFNSTKVIETTEYFSIYEQIVNAGIYKAEPICPTLKLHKDWDLNFKVTHELQYWHLRFQYDYIIEILLEGILNESISLQNCYIPLLFLIRHAIELSLKSFVWDLENFNSTDFKNSLCAEYKLVELHKAFDTFLGSLDVKKMDVEMQEELIHLRNQFNQHHETISALDVYNELFRFPGDKAIELIKIPLADLVALYYCSNSILTFNTETLIKEKILESTSY